MTHAADLVSYTEAILSRSDSVQHIAPDGQLNSSLIAQMYVQKHFATPTLYDLRELVPGYETQLDPGAAPVNSSATAYKYCKTNTLAVYSAGIPVLADTDSIGTGVTNVCPFSLLFGSSLYDELVNLVDAGLDPAAAIRGATLVPYMAHRLDGRGVVAEGHRADLVLLDSGADPLRNVSETRMIARVWNGGLEYNDVQTS